MSGRRFGVADLEYVHIQMENEAEEEEPWVLNNARIVHIALFGAVVLYQLSTTGLFLRYRARFTKNKLDSRLILLVSVLGALNLHFCSAENIFGDANIPCWLRHYVSFVQIPTFYFLVIVRAWRIVLVSRFQSALLARRNPSHISSFASYGNAGISSHPINTDPLIDLFHDPQIDPPSQKSDTEGAPASKKDDIQSSDDLKESFGLAKQKKPVSELRIVGWVSAFYVLALANFALVHYYFYPRWIKGIQSPAEVDDVCERIEDYPVYISNVIFLLAVPVCVNALRKVDDNLWLGTSLTITFAFSIPLMVMFHLSGVLPVFIELSREGCIADSFWLLPWYLICHSMFVGIPVFLELREAFRRNSQRDHPEINHEDFEDILSKPSRFREFKEYMTKELCVENALFYEQFTSLLSYVIKRRGNRLKGYLPSEALTLFDDQDTCMKTGTLPACLRQLILASKVPMDSRIAARLDEIYDTFIALDSVNQLNISHAVQTTLEKERNEGTKDLLSWKPVIKEVYYMMYSNTYFRYMNGCAWKKRLNQTNSRV